MHNLGGDTRDHIALNIPHPHEHQLPAADTERGVRRWSRHGLAAGTTLLVGTYLATFAAKLVVGEGQVFEHPTAQVFAVIGFISLHTLGTSLILIAGLERITRPQRTLIRRAMARADANAAVGETNHAAIEKNAKIVADLVYQISYNRKDIAALSSNLDRLASTVSNLEAAVEKIPDFAEGFSRGAYVTATALGLEKNE